MPIDDKRRGPPEDVASHLADTLTKNGAIEQVSDTTLGDSLAAQIGYLSGYTDPYGYEPWSWDGTTLTMLGDIYEGMGSSRPGYYGGFVEFNGNLYFTAQDATYGHELRMYDGTSVTLVEDIHAGSGHSSAGAYGGFTEFNGDLYFNAYDPTYGTELRKLDGTTGEITLVEDIYAGSTGSNDTYAGVSGGFTEFNGDLYFTAQDATYGAELRKLDGTTGEVTLVEDIYAGSGHSSAGAYGGFTEFNGDLYFTAQDVADGGELRKLDGTTGEITLVEDIYAGSGHSVAGAYGGFTEFNGDLYFTAQDATYGAELRKLDGTTGDVTLVEDIYAGSGSSGAGAWGGFIEFDGDLYFTAHDTKNGTELRKLDGTTGEISLIDIYAGSGASKAGGWGGFTEFNADLYFTAYDPTYGTELRKLDGDTGAIDTFDFLPGSGSSDARVIGTVNDHLVVTADVDTDNDGTADRYAAMFDASGEPTSVADFTLVDDPSGTFSPGSTLFTFEGDQFLF